MKIISLIEGGAMVAKYRQLHTEFWNDGFVLDLTPEEKYFYLYLMTNPHTAQCGIYKLPKRIIETHTGYSRETIDKLLSRFVEYNKIYYCNETKEIMIINWLKFNQPSSPNAVKCVNRELKGVKNKEFLNYIYAQCTNLKGNIEKLFKGIDGISIELSNGIEEKELPVREQQGDCNSNEEAEEVCEYNFKDVVAIFESNIHEPTPIEYDNLMNWSKKCNCNVMVLAIQEAVNCNVRKMRYIDKILYTWSSMGLATIEEVKDYLRAWEEKKKRNNDSFNCYDQRKYDYDELEKKLLGLDKEEEIEVDKENNMEEAV